MRVWSPVFWLFCAVAVVAIFWLPLHVAVPPSGSISYALGFNNHVALLACLGLFAAGAFALRGAPLVPERLADDGRVPRRDLLAGLLATAALCAGMAALVHASGGMDEAPYLITRTALLRAGVQPYLQMEFIYGPLMLYPTLWLSAALHISLAGAYQLWWSVQWLLGVPMMYAIVGWLRFPRRARRAAFWLLWSAYLAFVVNDGLTYTPTRELGVLFSVLATRELLLRGRAVLAVALALVLTAVLYGYSPEMGLAFTVVGTAVFGLMAWQRRAGGRLLPQLAAVAAFAAGGVLLHTLAAHFHEMDSAKGFNAGGSDIPLLLTPQTLFIFASVFAAACFAAQRLRRGELDDPRLAAVVVATALLPGAMGRSDPGHIMTYEMGALLVALYAAALRPRVWRWYAPLFLLLIGVALLTVKLRIDARQMADQLAFDVFPGGEVHGGFSAGVARAIARYRGDAMLAKVLRRATPEPLDPHAYLPAGTTATLYAPLGYYVNGTSSATPPGVERGYFDGFTDLMGPVALDRKLGELRAAGSNDLLMFPRVDPANLCHFDIDGANQLMRENFGYNYLRRERNRPTYIEPFCTLMASRYRRAYVASWRGLPMYSLWVPIAPETSAGRP